MYNKYFTMKRSELKEAIKNEITSVLLEGMSDEERENRIQHLMRTGAKEKPLRKLAAIGKKEDEKDLKEGKKGVVVDPDEIMMHINQYQSGNIDGDDLAQAIEEILVAMMNKSVTFSDIREGTWSLGKASDINMILSQLQDLSKKAYNIIGDDEFYNGIDAAITRAEELMMNAPLNEDEDEAPVGDKETEKTARGKDKITIDFRNVMKKYNELKEKDKKEAVEYLKSNQDIVKKYKKAKEVNV